MDSKQILNADFLDILYERMNKSYGSYQLRKTYNRRLATSLVLAILFFSAVVGGVQLREYLRTHTTLANMVITDVNLADIKEKAQAPAPALPPPPPKLEPPKIEIKSFTVPKIVDQVEEKKAVKQQDELENTTIGHIDQEGIKAPEIVNPPQVDKGSKVVNVPVAADEDRVFTKVEIEAAFPGGDNAWSEFVKSTIERHMDELVADGKPGTCTIQFIVDRDGNVSEVQALSMQGSKLAEIAVNAIRRGPRWIPAQQNGRKVNAFRRQNIVFELADQ